MKVEEAIQDFEQANFTQGRNPAPIRNKTQRISWVYFIRSVTRMLGARIWVNVLRSRLDRCSEGERELRERKKAQRLR